MLGGYGQLPSQFLAAGTLKVQASALQRANADPHKPHAADIQKEARLMAYGGPRLWCLKALCKFGHGARCRELREQLPGRQGRSPAAWAQVASSLHGRGVGAGSCDAGPVFSTSHTLGATSPEGNRLESRVAMMVTSLALARRQGPSLEPLQAARVSNHRPPFRSGWENS